jgi:hypothetical protein
VFFTSNKGTDSFKNPCRFSETTKRGKDSEVFTVAHKKSSTLRVPKFLVLFINNKGTDNFKNPCGFSETTKRGKDSEVFKVVHKKISTLRVPKFCGCLQTPSAESRQPAKRSSVLVNSCL